MNSACARLIVSLVAASSATSVSAQDTISAARRRAFFGELHLHTTMSFDAWSFGTKITPDQAYKFARGETVMVPALQVAREQGIKAGADVPAKRAWALDFAAVTDHSEFMGAAHQLDDPNSAFSQSELGRRIRSKASVNDVGSILQAKGLAKSGFDPVASQVVQEAAARSNAWSVEARAANDNYEPSRFTTFIAYEWSSTGGFHVTMHRNVIFNSDHAPAPFTALDSKRPEDLWKYLESVRRQGIDVLAIPHNSNLSDGHDFDWNTTDGRPIDEAYAHERALNEPLVEIAQVKGSSETTPELSPTDEFANFEILDRGFKAKKQEHPHGSYVREAYGRGLIIQSRVGVNPFKLGIVGASDIHNGLSASDEGAFAGGASGLDSNTMLPTGEAVKSALSTSGKNLIPGEETGLTEQLHLSGAAITGVWAEENTRDAIFAALKRRETFATSGTRIRLRMFGGWDFDPGILRRGDWVAEAYARGVPMGGDLPAKHDATAAPHFILQAQKDPDGANLDRIQIIKVWLEHGNYRERIFDVALSGNRQDDSSGHAPGVGSTVDLKTGAYRNTIGATTLTSVWSDPEFDRSTPAVYYARVLEIPTPRWSTLLAIKDQLPIPQEVPATIQERAWSSPIWFTPPAVKNPT